MVGPTTCRLLKMLATPKKLEEFEFSELVELARLHYDPTPSLIVKRFKFNSRCQKEGESISIYIVELRKIAEYRRFGQVLNDMLRDRLMCGIRNKRIQRRLLVESFLTFDKAIEMACAAEAADKDSLRLTGVTTRDNDQATPDQARHCSLVNKLYQKPHRNPHRGLRTSWYQ